jgi:RNA polymerase sigma factor (sigma-70 family)
MSGEVTLAGSGEQACVSTRGLEDLYREGFAPMVRLAYLLTGSRAVAEDLVQDCFVRLAPRFAQVERPAAYVRASVVNACRGYHRRTRRERAAFPELAAEELSPETPVLMDALAGLGYRQRAALVLRFYADRPEAEIADLLGCRPATVRSLVHRGLSELRKVIEP